DYRLIPENFDRQTQNAMVWGNAIGISDKYIDSPKLKTSIIREIIWFMFYYNIPLIKPDELNVINYNLQRKNIAINVDYNTLAIEKRKTHNI
ncbi:MAG: hypothetical protein FWC41_10325, partial [Firmicutes bacterium]|nr:hypothetical protein [Bacillota bacterium]